MIKPTLIFLTAMLACTIARAQSPKIIVPAFNDAYSAYVQKLEAGQTDINYKEFRYSFIESGQFKIARKSSATLDSLKKEMYELMEDHDVKALVRVTSQMLSIDYTSLIAHKILRQSYKALGDTAASRKYHDIQFGLLRSITSNGNGKTCETGWPVIQVAEEYFILEVVLGVELQKQSIDKTGGLCDRMDVKDGKHKKTYYFEASKIFEGYKKLGL